MKRVVQEVIGMKQVASGQLGSGTLILDETACVYWQTKSGQLVYDVSAEFLPWHVASMDLMPVA